MTALIDEFRGEHAQISDLLLKAKDMGVSSQQGRDCIFSAKKMLLAHLNKEDRFLYPTLRKAAETDDSLQKTLDSYAKDMENISADVMVFFELYESGENRDENFRKDCDNIIKALSKRIAKEEAVLYKQYDKVAESGH